MRSSVSTLTNREKETLRLLLAGHDAKSIARELGLSVHTVNERLRDARRKLDVSSSREAARLLAEAEERNPNSFVDMELRVGSSAVGSKDRPGGGLRLAWLGGGVLMLAFVIAGAAVWSASAGTQTQKSMPGRGSRQPRLRRLPPIRPLSNGSAWMIDSSGLNAGEKPAHGSDPQSRKRGSFRRLRTFGNPLGSVEIMELLAELNADAGLTIVLVTHEPDMAAYARRMVHFKDGLIDGSHASS